MDSRRTLLQLLYTKLHNHHPLQFSTHSSTDQLIPSIFSTTTSTSSPQITPQTSPSDQQNPPHSNQQIPQTPNPTSTLPRQSNGQRQQRHQCPATQFPLLSLPLDILQDLHSSLPLSSQIALRLTCSALWRCLRHPLAPLLHSSLDQTLTAKRLLDDLGRERGEEGVDDCTRDQVRYHHEEHIENASKGGRSNRRIRCALCKALYTVSLFHFDDKMEALDGGRAEGGGFVGRNGDGSRDVDDGLCYSGEEGGMGMMNPRNRVCKWHDGHFFRSVRRSSSTTSPPASPSSGRGDRAYGDRKEKIVEGWRMQEACMHCGTVFAWRTGATRERAKKDSRGGSECGNGEVGTRGDSDSGEYACECGGCDSCWRREVWTYTRVLDGEEQRVRDDAVLRWIF